MVSGHRVFLIEAFQMCSNNIKTSDITIVSKSGIFLFHWSEVVIH